MNADFDLRRQILDTLIRDRRYGWMGGRPGITLHLVLQIRFENVKLIKKSFDPD